MSEMSLEEQKYKDRSALVFLSFMAAPLVLLFAWGPILWVLAFIATFGLPIIGAYLIIRSNFLVDHEYSAVKGEIEGLVNDASFDISEQIIVWDKLRISKGIGTKMEGQDEEISEIYSRLIYVRNELSSAETPRHQLEAVLAADSLLATTRSLT